VLKCIIYLKDMNDFDAVNEVYARCLGGHRPVWVTVEVSCLFKDVLVEIDAIVVLGGG